MLDLGKLLAVADKEIACLRHKVAEQQMILLASEQQQQVAMQRMQEAADQLDAGKGVTAMLQ